VFLQFAVSEPTNISFLKAYLFPSIHFNYIAMIRRSLATTIIYCPIFLPFYAAEFIFVPIRVIYCNDADPTFMLVNSQMSLDSQLVTDLPDFLQFKNFANLPLRVVRCVLGVGTYLYATPVKPKGEVVNRKIGVDPRTNEPGGCEMHRT